ncbi:MAG: hypothetical protein AVDCRST_MAG67-4333 [uncultured Solirubrobacteraceae bacterium]|uniref:Uncharacterized protein n=1 Tax=uncultured Solirubrobacteraceae bacterium TaxID=1162706 RepID=A0A6J4TTJ9_9ACTN|nr:MAG: hypothetical protein AVDCRST_MAG67-4333 [uncultured Solirubrobacteraceae bacterium]
MPRRRWEALLALLELTRPSMNAVAQPSTPVHRTAGEHVRSPPRAVVGSRRR